MLLRVDGHVAIALIIGVVAVLMWYRGWPLRFWAKDGDTKLLWKRRSRTKSPSPLPFSPACRAGPDRRAENARCHYLGLERHRLLLALDRCGPPALAVMLLLGQEELANNQPTRSRCLSPACEWHARQTRCSEVGPNSVIRCSRMVAATCSSVGMPLFRISRLGLQSCNQS